MSLFNVLVQNARNDNYTTNLEVSSRLLKGDKKSHTTRRFRWDHTDGPGPKTAHVDESKNQNTVNE